MPVTSTPVTLQHQEALPNTAASHGNPWTQDPTALTTQQLQRELAGLQRIIETRLEGNDKAIDLLQRHNDREPSVSNVAASVVALQRVLETRLDSMDKALNVRMEMAVALKDLINESYNRLREMTDERFRSVQGQFGERDTRNAQSWSDAKAAVANTLVAAKETVMQQHDATAQASLKMESSFTKQMDSLATSMVSLSKTFDDKIVSVGNVLTAQDKSTDGKIDDLKTRVQSIESHSKGIGDVWGFLVGGVGVVIGVVAIFYHRG